MAMTPNTWYMITLDALAAPPYTAATYALTSPMIDLLIGGGPLAVFCLSDAGAGNPAVVSCLGGDAMIPSSAVNIISTPTMNTTVMDDSETWYSVRLSDGTWLFYGDQAGIVRSLAVPGALGVFIT